MVIHEKEYGLVSEPLADPDASGIVGLIEPVLKPSADRAMGFGHLRAGPESNREQVG
jgi:hypothetical protein